MWLTNAHEMPISIDHDTFSALSPWSDNYVTYIWSPENGIGIYFHLCRTLSDRSIWRERVTVVLPDDRVLVFQGNAKGIIGENSFTTCGISLNFGESFDRLKITFRGEAQLVTRQQYLLNSIQKGAQTTVKMNLTFKPISPPFEFKTEDFNQALPSGHFSQHGRIDGTLIFHNEDYAITGSGLRDHSWGVRNFQDMANSVRLHGQFLQSGRSLTIYISSENSSPDSMYKQAVACVPSGILPITFCGVNPDMLLETPGQVHNLKIGGPWGDSTVIKSETLKTIHSTLATTPKNSFQNNSTIQTTHHNFAAFTQLDWEGETGYGMIESILSR